MLPVGKSESGISVVTTIDKIDAIAPYDAAQHFRRYGIAVPFAAGNAPALTLYSLTSRKICPSWQILPEFNDFTYFMQAIFAIIGKYCRNSTIFSFAVRSAIFKSPDQRGAPL